MDYKEVFIYEESITDLDGQFPFYNPGSDEPNGVMMLNDLRFDDDVPAVSITDLRNILTKLEEKGAERVYIATHCDHRGYYFTGIKIVEDVLLPYIDEDPDCPECGSKTEVDDRFEWCTHCEWVSKLNKKL